MLRFSQTSENYLKVSNGKDSYTLNKYIKIQVIDTTKIKFPNVGSDSVQKWNNKCNIDINQSRTTDFIKSTKTTSPTGLSGATSIPQIGTSFMYLETSSTIHGHERVFVSFERTDIVQISIITFYYNRFSILTNDSKKSMGRFRFQLFLKKITHGVLNITHVKMVDIVIHQLIGH